MSPELYIAGGGFLWWAFFEWMRGWERNRDRGTQHLCMIGLLGLGAMIFGFLKLLLEKAF